MDKLKVFNRPLTEDVCDIMVIGDAPTMPEVSDQKAFVAHAATFFKKTLGAVIKDYNDGHEEQVRPRVHFTYAVQCYSKDEPSPAAIKSCNGRLLEEIKQKQPKVIITLGNGAMASLGRTRAGILSARGRRKWDSQLNAYILATFHPSFVLKNTSTFETWTQDLAKAVAMVHRPKGKPYLPPKTKVDVLKTMGQTKKFLQLLRNRDQKLVVASDIETRGFNFRKDKLLSMGFAFKKGHAVVIPEEIITDPDITEELKATVESDMITWVYHNGKFDNKFLWAQYGIKARTDIDTMLKHYCIDVRKGTHDLEQVAMEYCDAEPWEHEAHQYVKESFADIPRDILYHYQGVDCDMTLRVNEALDVHFEAERRKGRKIDKLMNLLNDAGNNYMRIELNGFLADVDYVKELEEEYIPLLEQGVKDMCELALVAGWDNNKYAEWATEHKTQEWGRRGKREGKKKPGPVKVPAGFNPNSYMHIRFLLFGLWNMKPIMKKGKISTDADSLEIYKNKLRDVTGIRFLETKMRYAKDKKLFGTYVKGLAKHMDEDTHRVHTTFKLHGTETGRLASSDPNIHNIPRNSKIKNIFVAPKGKVLVQADYSQAELRVMAVEADDPWLKNVYISGSDLHDQMSLQLYGENFTKEQRVRAKAVNFGIPYGRTEFTLAAEHNMSVPEARKLIKDWFAPQPKTKAFMDARRQEPLQGKFYETPIGRVRPFGLITERNMSGIQNEAGNFPIQSTASDLGMYAICQITRELDDLNEKYGRNVAMLVNTVHDSIIAEVEEDEEIILIVREIMNRHMTSAGVILLDTEVPFKADFEIGYRWGHLADCDVEDDKLKITAKIGGQKHVLDFKQFTKELA